MHLSIQFPTLDQLIGLHDAGLSVGGSEGIRDIALVEGALENTKTALYYDDPRTVPQAAAMLCEKLVKAHAFLDGNKRTAVLTFLTTLSLNGWVYQGGWKDLTLDVISAAETGRLPDRLITNCIPAPVVQHLMDYDRGTFTA